MNKKNILVLVTVFIAVVMFFGAGMILMKSKENSKEHLEHGRLPEPKVQSSSILSETHTYGNLNFTGFVINYIDNIYTIFVNIANKSENTSIKENVFIVLYDKEGNEITKIDTEINSLKPYENYVLSIETNKNIFSTNNYEIINAK